MPSDEFRELTGQEAYDEGFREAKYRFERELDYLRGQVAALQQQNESILKHMSSVYALLPMPPILVKASDVDLTKIKP